MAAPRILETISQGETWLKTLVFEDDEGNPADLEDATASLQIRANTADSGAPALLTLEDGDGITITPEAGQADIHITAAETSALAPAHYRAILDFEITLASGITYKLMCDLVIEPEANR